MIDPQSPGHPARLHTARHPEGIEAVVRLRVDGLVITSAGEERVWHYGDVRRRGGEWGPGVLHLEHDEGREMLAVVDAVFASGMRLSAPALAPTRSASRGTRVAIGLVIALAIGVVAFFLALPWLAGLLAAGVPVEWEDRFGAAVVESAVPKRQRIEDPAVRAVVEGVVARLATAVPSPYTFRVTVADQPEVNAFAAPGGHMMVNRGLLTFAGDGDELAAVLAHEMEHVTRRHVTRVMFQRASLGFLAALAGGQSADVLGGGIEAARMLGDLSFGRAAEREADEGGLARLRAAGIAPGAMARMLERLAGEQKGAEPPELLSSHPDPRGRAARMRELALKSPGEGASAAVSPEAWAAMRVALRAGPHAALATEPDTLFRPMPVKVVSRTVASGPRGHVSKGLNDKAGRLWFGSSEGLMRWDGRSFTLFTEVDDGREARGYANWEHIYSIFEDRAGNIWFGAPNGLYRYDGRKFARFAIPARDFKDLNDYPSPEFKRLNPLPPTAVISILQDKRGALWFGTWGGGVNHYDGRTLTNLSEKNGLCSNVVQDILEDRDENLWFATRGGGVCRYDGHSFTTYATPGDAISYHASFIAADSAGALWIGSVGGGLRRFDGAGFTPVTEPDLINATCVLQARNGERWYGSDGSGVRRFDGRSFTRFTTKDGLCSNSVWAIVEDDHGVLWFCTRKGLCRYDGRSFTSLASQTRRAASLPGGQPPSLFARSGEVR